MILKIRTNFKNQNNQIFNLTSKLSCIQKTEIQIDLGLNHYLLKILLASHIMSIKVNDFFNTGIFL